MAPRNETALYKHHSLTAGPTIEDPRHPSSAMDNTTSPLQDMQTPTPPPSAVVSPTAKRKRPLVDAFHASSPSPTRLKTTNLPSRPLLDKDPAVPVGSPRTTVAGHLQSLEIEERAQIPNLDFSSLEGESSTPVPAAQDRQSPTGTLEAHIALPSNETSFPGPITPPSSSHSGNILPLHSQQQQQHLQTDQMEIPSTPSPPPIQPASNTHPSNDHSRKKSPPLAPSTTSTDSTGASTTTSLSSPPSLLQLWWTESEITGHTLNDPNDDGYGINGVGFIPTPAMATARAEKRRRQVRDWKEREAREARARRGERRRRARAEDGPPFARGGSVGGGGNAEVFAAEADGQVGGYGLSGGGSPGKGEGEGRRVRFLEV